ncbi:unnamed protein product [Rotaria sp. Silwood2]|nr:unnamed protein product [Rotaria sp. Silwood2]CAF3220439.1 unnamed protein product [Rotaria sp. Silwood2]CAF4597919.1 unnamed protein product [Rotaria sp. Silwood2]CAF4608635.1 unnamed protein product [Rotaria sp. Silwood2]
MELSISIESDIDNCINKVLSALDIHDSIKQNFKDIYDLILKEIDKLKFSIGLFSHHMKQQQIKLNEFQTINEQQVKQLQDFATTNAKQLKVLQDLQNLNQDQERSLHEFKDQNTSQRSKIDGLVKKIDSLELSSSIQNITMEAYEVIRLFQFYYVNDAICAINDPKIDNWQKLTDQWCLLEMELLESLKLDQKDVFSDSVQEHPSIVKLVAPIEKELESLIHAPFKLINIRKISNERHGFAHVKMKCVDEQQSFIKHMQNEMYPEEYAHTLIIKQIVSWLLARDRKKL